MAFGFFIPDNKAAGSGEREDKGQIQKNRHRTIPGYLHMVTRTGLQKNRHRTIPGYLHMVTRTGFVRDGLHVIKNALNKPFLTLLDTAWSYISEKIAHDSHIEKRPCAILHMVFARGFYTRNSCQDFCFVAINQMAINVHGHADRRMA